MSLETRKQLGVWGILAIGFVLGYAVAGGTSKPEPMALASGDGDADQRADGNRGEDFAEGCPVDDENFGAETKRGPVTEF